MGEDYKFANLIQTKARYVNSDAFGHLFKIQKILRTNSLQEEKPGDFLAEGHSTLYFGFFLELSQICFIYLLLENLFLNISAETAGMKFLPFHFSVFLKLELYQLFPCTYITVMHQRMQNNSQKIRVHFVWVH